MRKSRRTFWKVVPLFHGNGYLALVLATPVCGIATLFSLLAIFGCINNGRARVYRARVNTIWKIAFTFTMSYLQGFPAPFPAVDVSQTFHTQFCESDVKRLRPFAPAGNAREPLYTGTFSIICEGESDFLNSVFRKNAITFHEIPANPL